MLFCPSGNDNSCQPQRLYSWKIAFFLEILLLVKSRYSKNITLGVAQLKWNYIYFKKHINAIKYIFFENTIALQKFFYFTAPFSDVYIHKQINI